MAIFVARQPIFDKNLNVFAYELLYRSDEQNKAVFVNDEVATSRVINNSLLSMGIDKVTASKKMFINFSKALIESDIPTLLSPEIVVIEILEDVVPDRGFIDRCKELKKMGFVLALDDFVLGYEYTEMLDYVDIVKVDFMLTDKKERAQIIKSHRSKNISFLAEKVETLDEFKEAVRQGYKYFQGFFFEKPVIMKSKDTKSFSGNYMIIMEELNKKDPQFPVIAKVIERDLNLTFKLLRMINSMTYYRGNKIESILQALTMLGLGEVKKWISLLMLQDVCTDKPDALISTALLRGKFAEELATTTAIKNRKSEAFLMGLFSLIDVMLDRKMEEILESLPLKNDVKDGIQETDNIFGNLLKTVIAYEKGQWNEFDDYAGKVGDVPKNIARSYLASIKWVEDILEI